MSRVVVVGSVNLDLVSTVPRLPAAGETVLGSDVAYQPGGKGGNQAVAAARLDADTLLVAAVGDDSFGADLREALLAEGLPATGVTTIEGTPTGIAMIVVDGDGGNLIVVAPGANARLAAGRIDVVPDEFWPGAVLLLQLEIPLDTCLHAATRARRAGASVVLNAAPLSKTDDPVLAELLGAVDVLVVNQVEAASLAGLDTDWAGVAATLRSRGPAAVVVTLGADGAVAVDDDGTRTQPAYPVHAVDTTGAGDSFCGTLAVALAEQRPLAEAVRRGCAAGALSATKLGAQPGLPTGAELEAFLAGRTEG